MSDITLNNCRQEVRDFAIAMELKLRQNEHKKHWSECSFNYFLIRMEEEIDEARRAFFQWLDGVHSTQAEEYIQRFENDMALEAVDVANFAMFYYSMAMAHNRRPCKLEEFEAFMKAKEIER